MGTRATIAAELHLSPEERREMEREWVRNTASRAFEPVEDPQEDPANRPQPISTPKQYFD